MPFLRLHNDPHFKTVGEAVEFFRQVFEVRTPLLGREDGLTPFTKHKAYSLCMSTISPIGEMFGLVFCMILNVHRDCMYLNIMMDPEPMFPNLYHPAFPDQKRDFSSQVKYYSRTERPTRYYLIDFSLSRKYEVDNLSPLELPITGGDNTVPEFQGEKYNEASDPFATDVCYVGNVIQKYFLQVSSKYH